MMITHSHKHQVGSKTALRLTAVVAFFGRAGLSTFLGVLCVCEVTVVRSN